jgi:hypothetical protein
VSFEDIRRARVRFAIPAIAALVPLLFSRFAVAQGSDRAVAEELFRQGQSLMQAQRFAEACPKLAESQRLDPGTGTLLNLGVCHEREGKLASAWAEYNDVLTLAQRDGREDRVAYARERIAAIEPRLSRLKIELSAASDIPTLEVQLDGNVVGRPTLGVALPVDPGTHRVAASASGKRPWETSVTVPTGPAEIVVALPVLTDAPTEPVAPAAPGAASNPTADRPHASNTQRILAYGLGGLGLLGIGVGSVFGLKAISQNDESNQRGCVGNECTASAGALREDAQSAGTLSTVAFAVGGAALAGGVVLFLTAPSSKDQASRPVARIAFAPSGGRLQLGTTW